ncbi:putative PEP-CTERM system TPR-repeat lipoprotein [Marinobacter antarcticus]|uniref:Putative PEP-CTERM system TPR-repeat lipoprotein n=1 Tax=Marinobacter antarcticus TaxID=564117 RepID=A0A1M6SNP6_9GAMM|nr:tetratricopeptide repeat protein [Marinobacter antarcticus]SHK46267.1 putative PEP-CTERM system TPR-repeat lipoprotein [Marinobacter antarcticus]
MMKRQTLQKSLPRLVLAGSLLLAFPLLSGCNNGPDSSEALSHITRAETYSEQGQFRSALLEVKNAIQKDPNNVEHIVRLADLYLQVSAAKEASDLLAPWVKEQPDAVGLTLARAYVEQGKHLSATETLALQTPSSPEDQLEAALIRAEALRRSGEAAEALALYNSLSASNGSNIQAITGALQAQINLGKNAQAIEAADVWLAKNETAPEVLYWKGLAQYRQNQLKEASATLTDAVGVLPTSDIFLPIRRNVLTTLSRVLTEQGQITEAQIYNRILAENMNSGAREQAEAAVAALKEGNFEEAKAILRDTLKLNPENEQVALMLGAISAGTGELDEGAQLLKENLDPETTPVQFIRAATMAQIDTGDREAALTTLDRAIKARPNDNELLAMHGILALSLPGRENDGIASLSKAIGNEPERVRLRLALARHYLQNEQPEQALGQLRMAFTANPADWATTSTYLNVLIQQGEKQEAGEIRDSLLNGYGDQPRAVLLASLADAQLGNPEAATTRLEKLTKDSPKLQQPKVALANLYAQSGQREKAVSMLVDAAAITPEAIRPLQQAGQIYMQDHTVDEAKTWLASVAKTNPELEQNTDTLTALIAITQGELANARTTLSKWKDTDSATVKRALGQLLLAEAKAAADNKEWPEARAKAAEAIALEPENIGFALLPAGIAQMEGKLDDAFLALDAVEQTHGEVPATILSRARLLQQQKGPEAAYNYLADKWQATKDQQIMPSLLGLAKEQAPGAVDGLTDSWVQEAPDSLPALLTRAEWLMTDGQETAAASYYEKVLSQQPNNVAALNNLAWTLREENPDRALKLAKQASELAPNSPAVLDTYGWVLHLAGKHAEAKTAIEKALDLAPGNAEIGAHLEAVKKAM